MARVQGATGVALGAASITATLNGVVAGNLLTIQLSYYYASGGAGQAGPAAPSGWKLAYAPVTIAYSSAGVGTATYFRDGAPSGTHSPVVTLPAGSFGFLTLSEFPLAQYPAPVTVDVTATNGGSASNTTAWNTGTTSTTTQATALVLAQVDGDEASGSTNIGLSTPAASGYTNVHLLVDASVNEQGSHDFKEISATGTQTASWTKTAFAGTQGWQSSVVVLKGDLAPKISAQPQNTNVVNGTTAVFSVTSPNATSYQWQDNSSGTFADISGAVGSTYTTAATTATFQRRRYRCNVTNADGTVTSSEATLTLSWHDVYLYTMPEDADPDDVRLRDPTTVAAGSPDVSRSLTGIASTFSAGTIVEAITYSLSGAVGTFSAGTLSASPSYTLTGQAGTFSAGSLARAISYTLTGAASTATAGTLSSAISYTLNGVAVTVSAGTLTATVNTDISRDLTGIASTVSAGSITSAISYSLAGQASTVSAGQLAPAIAYSVTGQAGTFSAGTLTSAIAYTLNGAQVTVSAGIITQSGGTSGGDVTLSLTGIAATVSAGNVSSAIAYALAGQSSAVSAGLLNSGASYGIAGPSVTVSAGSVSEAIDYGLTGVESVVSAGNVTAQAGGDVSKTLTGASATFEAGNITVSGGDVVGGGHGFEMGGEAPRKRRNLVYIVEDEPRSSAHEPVKVAISFSEARKQAEEIIKAAATEHAATKVSRDVRFGYVRASLKPIQPALNGWNWVNMYQRLYDAAIMEQLRQQEVIADQLEEDSAIAFLLLNM